MEIKNKLESASFIVLLVTLFLSPIVFLNTSFLPFDAVKAFVVIFGVLISGLLYVISMLKENSIVVYKNPLSIVSVLILLSGLVSALLSSNFQKSLIGQGIESASLSYLATMFLAMFMISRLVVNNKDRLNKVYGTLGLSFFVLGLFHVLRLFVSPSLLSFGIFNYPTASLIGRWFDFGIFSGIIFLLSFIAINNLSLKGVMRILTYVALVTSGLLLFVVNSTIIWSVIALVLLSYAIYVYVNKIGTGSGIAKFFSRLSILALVLLVLSAIFAWNGDKIATTLSKTFSIEQTEVPLPWQLTLDVTADTIKSNPLFGAGPNRFGSEYLLYKPQVVNPSIFWSAEFGAGFGYLPTFAVTQGMMGVILWVIFFVFFFILGIRGLKNITDPSARFFTISSFFGTSFLWLTALLYSPSHVVLLMTFSMTGLFVASLCSGNIIKSKEYAFTNNPKLKNIVTALSIVLIVLVSLWLIINIKKMVALSYFQSAASTLNISNNADIDKAEGSIRKALSWDRSDTYYRAISEISLIKVNPIIKTLQEQAQKDSKNIDQELVKKLNELIQDAATSTTKAINIDPTNYNNYVSEARVYDLASSLSIPNAYENSKISYANALKYNPYNPQLYLSLAQLEASKDKPDEAIKYIGAALQLKQNYTEAIFLLSQIQVAQGKIKDAITSAQVMTQINPGNSLLFFQLGFLNYSDKNYKDAVDALSKAVELNNQYANARYFLGLSLVRLSKNTEAVSQFEEILKTNPDNQEVLSIIATLKAGKSPFNDAKASVVDSKPESRKTLPVKEKANTNTSN